MVADEKATGAPATMVVLTISMNFPLPTVPTSQSNTAVPSLMHQRAQVAVRDEGLVNDCAVTVGMLASVSVPVGVSVAQVVVLLDTLSESSVCVVMPVSGIAGRVPSYNRTFIAPEPPSSFTCKGSSMSPETSRLNRTSCVIVVLLSSSGNYPVVNQSVFSRSTIDEGCRRRIELNNDMFRKIGRVDCVKPSAAV